MQKDMQSVQIVTGIVSVRGGEFGDDWETILVFFPFGVLTIAKCNTSKLALSVAVE